MTESARFNLQMGVKEDKRFPHTTYNIESPLDAYIIHKQQIREQTEQYLMNEYLQKIDKQLLETIKQTTEKAIYNALK